MDGDLGEPGQSASVAFGAGIKCTTRVFYKNAKSVIIDRVSTNLTEQISRRLPGFPGGFLNSSRFSGFPGVVDTLIKTTTLRTNTMHDFQPTFDLVLIILHDFM